MTDSSYLELRAATETFTPPIWLRNTHVQTIGASLFSKAPKLTPSKRQILVTAKDIKLEAFLHEPANTSTPGDGSTAQAQVILLHGWLGSADSSYILNTAHELLSAGYRVARLNLRDHGNTSHLNEEMFHSARIEEVVDACLQLADRPSALIGYSLGGNFALRVCAHTALPALAICPAIDPARSCTTIDEGSVIYRKYFLRKWYRALAVKAAAFPELYDFSRVQNIPTVLELTKKFIGGHLPYSTSAEYFNAYRIRASMLKGRPAKIIAAKDDPVIPWQTVSELAANVDVLLTEHGGHCGYLPRAWLRDQLLDFLRKEL